MNDELAGPVGWARVGLGGLSMTSVAEIISELENLEEAELRRSLFSVATEAPDPGQPYPHQIEALRRIELGANRVPPVSGILHYPTGAGKTRVGVELIARALRADPRHRFVWATHTKNLIRQSMVRLVEASKLFPPDTTFTWAENPDELEDSEDDVHVVFLTRTALTKVLGRAGDRRCRHPWRLRLERGDPMTLIYDECHQLGAEKLQDNWLKFHETVIAPAGGARRSWRTIGLSATPVPTQLEAHPVLRECIFPKRSDGPSTSHDWPFHVIHRVRNETLVDSDVLCQLNPYFDRHGEFDLPADLLQKIIGDAHLRAPGAGAAKADVQKYSMQFNSRVLADPRVLEFLAKRLGTNRLLLGKTIVFVPNIEAANRLVGLLYEGFPELRGHVAAVHSKMDQLRVPGQERATVHEVLGRFRSLGHSPSILVNVDMLAEGFDDPRIKTVVLARLTLSTNRFWQMVGRGTRGPAAGGTEECNVIDPIKLTRLYEYFRGYQPSFGGEDLLIEFEDLDEPEPGQDALPPQVPAVSRPPDPGCGAYQVDQELERLHGQIARVLRHFLNGEQMSEGQAVEAAQKVRVALSNGHAMLQPSDGHFAPDTATAILLGEISSLQRRAGVELAWVKRQLPPVLDEALLKQRMRMLRAIEALKLWTESAFALAQTDGAFLAALQIEATGTAAGPTASAPSAAASIPFEPGEEAALDSVLAVAAVDGHLAAAEIAVVVETLRRMFGRAATPELEATIKARSAPSTVPLERLEQTLTAAQLQLLLLQMAEVAAADGIVTAGERTMLDSVAARLRIPDAFLGGHLARADVKSTAAPTPAPAGACPGCAFDTPSGAAFCPSCGVSLRQRPPVGV
jgi:superfamily II DNA or RNA helicase